MASKGDELLANLLERDNKTPFTAKFNGEPRKTLEFISQINRYLLVNGFTSPIVKFRRIFNTLSEAMRRSFLNEYTKAEEMTVEFLTAWLLVQYPPSFNKHHFIMNLKAMTIRRNENPKNVWNRVIIKQKQMNEAIALLNVGVNAKKERIRQLTEEQVIDALTGIFIRKNNRADYDNDGNINRMTINYLAKKNPKTLKDWREAFDKIGDELVPRCTQSDTRYQYTTYPPDPLDLDIYAAKSKVKKAKKSQLNGYQQRKRGDGRRKGKQKSRFQPNGRRLGRKRAYWGDNNADGPSPRKQKYNDKTSSIECYRCGKRGHKSNNCQTNYDASGQFINDGNPFCHNCKQRGHLRSECTKKKAGGKVKSTNSMQLHCTRCLRNNHLAKDCFAKTYQNGQPIEGEINAFQKGANDYNADNCTGGYEAIKRTLALLTQNVQKDENLTQEEKDSLHDQIINTSETTNMYYARH